MAYDEMELDLLGDRRTALFVIISDTDDIGGLANLLSDSRASGGVGCGIVVHSKSSCK